jgi:LAS superfamily LD-carboxypeptidase LdcB
MEKGSIPHIAAKAKKHLSPLKGLLVLLILALAGVVFYYQSEVSQIRAEFASSTAMFTQRVQGLEATIVQLTEDNDDLSDDLRKEKKRNQNFEDQIDEIAGTVSVLDKLRRTDPELLKKYSKVAFLNENYLPEKLEPIDKAFVFGSTEQRVHVGVAPFLEDLLEDAKDDDIDLRVVSAYRSFGTQAALKSQYSVVYGTGANQFSADQGYSEHQLGTTIDVSVPELNGKLDGFDATAAYQWLLKNAYKYGFVLSYPPGNAYYQFEPWHWRFVSADLANDLHRANKYFYDMDQRDIDAYLVSIFD